MVLGLLQKGDEVLNVTNEFVAIRREGGEVDIIPVVKEDASWWVDCENIVTIGYGENTITYEMDNGLRVINF